MLIEQKIYLKMNDNIFDNSKIVNNLNDIEITMKIINDNDKSNFDKYLKKIIKLIHFSISN